jgi:hypothetical protein
MSNELHSELYAKFTSNQNKGLVWKLLGDDGVFNGIPEGKSGLIKNEFDRKFALIASQLTPADNVINLDKRVMTEMIKDMALYKNNNEKEIMYNAADLAQIKQQKFAAELSNKKKEFDNFTTPVPEKIDFSDDLDTPIGSEMDKILAEQIALRENQLNMVLSVQDKAAATKWLQTPKERDVTKLKIGENVNIELASASASEAAHAQAQAQAQASEAARKPKKVVFADTLREDDDNFLSLLKKKGHSAERQGQGQAQAEPSSILLLREILANQKQILEILKTKN